MSYILAHGTEIEVPLWELEASWNVMSHAQKPDFVFRRNGRVHLNRRGRQFSQLLAAEVCASAVVMLDTPCSEVVWRVLDTHSIRQFPLHFPSCASSCAITFQLESTDLLAVLLQGVVIRFMGVLLRGFALAVLMSAIFPKRSQAGFDETLGFGATWASDCTKNWKNKQDCGSCR